MPIYEYEARDAESACPRCRKPFEMIQALRDPPLEQCPACGGSLRKLISRCRAAVVENDDVQGEVESRIREHEGEGRWSHAAELADSHAAKTRDGALKMRALDNYKKAGYPLETLEKHAKTESD